MSGRLRRLLAFALLAGGGVLILVLLSDGEGSARSRGLGRGLSPGDDATALGLVDAQSGVQTQVTLQRVEFQRTRSVETEPGRFEERPVALISLRNGRPTPTGDLLVDEPTITYLDEQSGAPSGRLQAERGVFPGFGGAGGLRVDGASAAPEVLLLSGDVRGELPLGGDRMAGLATAEILLTEGRAEAAGEVALTWGLWTLTGTHMTWDEAASLLVLARDVRVVQPEVGSTPGFTLLSPDGLEWHLPPEGEGEGRGLLRGPVTGHSTQGGAFSAQRMDLLVDASSALLTGAAEVQLDDERTVRRLQAERLLLGFGDGGPALSQAEGDVRLLLSEVGGRQTTLRTPLLLAAGNELVAPREVRLEQDGLAASGHAWRWDETARAFTTEEPVRVEILAASGSPQAGARLTAIGGLHAVLPAEDDSGAVLARLFGPVVGNLPDGSRLAGDLLVYDGAASTLTLAGNVAVDAEDVGGPRRIEADELVLGLSESELGRVVARGRVLVERREVEGLTTSLAGEHVELEAGRLRATGPVRLARGELVLTGGDLLWREDEGRLELARDATILRSDAATGERHELHSPGGLIWWLPEGPSATASGHGELRGPVTGRGSAGWHLATETLHARLDDGRLQARAPETFRWHEAAFTVEGQGLVWDEAEGRLHVERDVHLVQRNAAGAPSLELRGGGPLEARVPPERDSALWVAELSGGVEGRSAQGGLLAARRVVLDGPARTLLLDGNAQAALDDTASLSAAGRVRLLRDAADEVVFVEAQEDVVLHGAAEGEVWTARGETLAADRRAHTLTLTGPLHLEHLRGLERTLLTTGPQGRLLALTDAAGALLHADVAGRVLMTTADLSAEADRVTFDLREDFVILEGDCILGGATGGLQAPRIELWPRQMRWKIPHALVELPGTSPTDG